MEAEACGRACARLSFSFAVDHDKTGDNLASYKNQIYDVDFRAGGRPLSLPLWR